ncbi:MAG: tRNA lysidine(34) synthetase TilS, partial [Verrucomicrobiae bacterium]|nr:tRNA lysidine(34) synthetase TilS [Verrucomicrobiae bacterium]
MNWPAKAQTLGQLIGKSELHKQAVRYLEANRAPVGVACSGGLDSVSALLLIYCHFHDLRSRLYVIHFNHKIRGVESDEDEAFTRDLAASLGLPFFQATWTSNESGKSVSEAQARKARHEFYDSFLEKHPGAILITGHQQEDILENLLLKLARSSNLTGLSAPRPVQTFDSGKVIVRPLLSLRKSRLEEALRQSEIPWREDCTNLENHFDRNRLRNIVIPAWENATQFDLFQAAERVRTYLEEADEV